MSDIDTTELDRIRGEQAFYEEIIPLQVELEDARKVKADDPVRFQEAKQAFEEKRTAYRRIAEQANTDAVQVSTISGEASVKPPFGTDPEDDN